MAKSLHDYCKGGWYCQGLAPGLGPEVHLRLKESAYLLIPPVLDDGRCLHPVNAKLMVHAIQMLKDMGHAVWSLFWAHHVFL